MNAVSEHDIQATFVDWCRRHEHLEPRLRWLHAIPNGGKRAYKTALALKAEGVLPGVADIFLPVPSGDKHGLWIEFKSQTGHCTQAQADFGWDMVERGYAWRECHSADEAIAVVSEYLAAVGATEEVNR